MEHEGERTERRTVTVDHFRLIDHIDNVMSFDAWNEDDEPAWYERQSE